MIKSNAPVFTRESIPVDGFRVEEGAARRDVDVGLLAAEHGEVVLGREHRVLRVGVRVHRRVQPGERGRERSTVPFRISICVWASWANWGSN